jgi:peptide/nickel transport system substrate-binding protein
MTLEISRRTMLRNAVVLGGGALVLNACTGASGRSAPPGGRKLPPIQGSQVITDRSKFPAALHESPEFAAQVAAGKLDPVAKRVGQDPLVIKPAHGIGKYGGQLRTGMIGNDTSQAQLFSGPDNLLYWDYLYENVIPNIALGYEMSSDFRELTLHMRRGMRWSDGQPFTADDIIFWREDLNLSPDIGYYSTALTLGGKNVSIEKVDDLTVVFRSPVPYGSLAEQIAGGSDIGGAAYNGQFAGGGFAPKHYLSQFLPKYTSETQANKLAKQAGFDGWVSYVLNQNSWFYNTELPVLTPWVCTRSLNEDIGEFAANPYSIWVDTAGNQLPYVSKGLVANAEDPQVLALNTVSGQYDWQDRGLAVASLPVLIRNEKRSNYRVHQAPDDVMDLAIIINLALPGEMGDLLRTTDFRRALSLGIDRQQANATFFLGTGLASATMCGDSSPYFPGPGWRTKWATHDVKQANKLLDGLGLTKRDGAGFRLLPSGAGRIQMQMESTNTKADFPTMGEMIRQHWRAIGIDAFSDVVDGSLLQDRAQGNKAMCTVNNIYGVEDPFLSANGFLPVTGEGTVGSMMAYAYAQWFISGGKKGIEPPESMSLLKEAVQMLHQGIGLPRDKRAGLGKKLFMMHADQVWTIGVVGMGLEDYGLYANTNRLGNVPGRITNTYQTANTNLALPQTFYFT